jgi:ribosome-associated toxin RatA of RatAB toxin-antitoxin module
MEADRVRRDHFVPGASPDEVYAVVVDFPAYPRLFPEFQSTRVLATEEKRVRVEFNVKVMLAVRYVLDLVCDAGAHSVDWTFVEGEVVTDSQGSWRFTAEGGGTRVDYTAALEVRAPLPGFMLRKITETVLSASIPKMFSAITSEVAVRKAHATAARPSGP